MEPLTNIPTLIEKEEVSKLYFSQNDVLDNSAERMMRQVDIIQATRLGNIERYKVKIIFEDTAGLKKVETTIWAVTEKEIVLKKGVVIPVHRIHKIDFF